MPKFNLPLKVLKAIEAFEQAAVRKSWRHSQKVGEQIEIIHDYRRKTVILKSAITELRKSDRDKTKAMEEALDEVYDAVNRLESSIKRP